MKKNSIIEISIVRALVVIIQLVFLKIYTRHTSLYELGIYYFLITISYSLNAFIFVPLDLFQQSQLYKLKENGFSLKSFHIINKWAIYITVAVFILAELVCIFCSRKYCFLIPLVILLAINLYFVTFIRGILNNLERRRVVVYSVLVEIITKISFFLIIIKFYNSSAIIILIATITASSLVLICLLAFIQKLPEYKLSNLFNFKFGDILKFAYPITIGSVVNWIQIQGYRMILVPLGLVEIVGLYGTVANVGSNAVVAYSTIFTQISTPILYKTNGSYIRTYLRNAFISLIIIFVGGFLFSKFLVALFTKNELVAYSLLILYGILTEGVSLLISPLLIFLTIYNKTRVMINLYFIALVVFLVSFILIYFFDIINVYTIGLPIVITQIFIAIYLYIIVTKILKVD